MRITVNLRDEALELARKKSEESGRSLGEVVSEAIIATYQERPVRARDRRYDLPVSGRGGLHPGVDLDCSADLEDLLDGRR